MKGSKNSKRRFGMRIIFKDSNLLKTWRKTEVKWEEKFKVLQFRELDGINLKCVGKKRSY